MKKAIFTAFCLGLTALSANVVSLPDMSEEMLTNLMEGEAKGVVIELPRGATLPLRLFLQGDCFSLNVVEETPYKVTIEKTVFVKLEEENFYFSQDLKEWKPIDTFFTGSFGVSLGVENGKQELSFHCDLNERDE